MDVREALDATGKQPRTEYGRRFLNSLMTGIPVTTRESYGDAADRRIAALEQENKVLRNWLGLFLQCMRRYFQAIELGKEEEICEAAAPLLEHWQRAQRHYVIHEIMDEADPKNLEDPPGHRFERLEF